MNLEELKALLESGAITEAQFKAMCKQFGFEVPEPTPDPEPEPEPDDNEKLLEKKIQQAVDRATNKLGNDNKKLKEELEKLRKEKLTAAELKEIEDAEKEKDLAEREAAVKALENKMYAVSAIKKAGLDDGSETALDILNLVNAGDEESIDKNIKALKALVDKLVKAEIEKTFRSGGRNPEKGGSGSDGDNPYMAGASFNLTKQMELEATNPELAKKLKAAVAK
uniref:capsid assembly scaffolding protein Gp46 family protein n=1 Tax=Acetatifactor sp. TaxID=1872090 RepID=UPI004055E0FD